MPSRPDPAAAAKKQSRREHEPRLDLPGDRRAAHGWSGSLHTRTLHIVTWTVPTPEPLADNPVTGEDRPILEGMLAWQRHTLWSICAGLTADQLAARALPPSNLSLLGLVRHLTKVERIWLRERFACEAVDPLHGFGTGRDLDFDDLDPARAAADLAAFADECRAGDAAVAALTFDHPVEFRGQTWSLRFVYVHLVSEYARHNGHADLLRERIDGVTGR
jgi:uncharacterized damage-inducible protein DinB